MSGKIKRKTGIYRGVSLTLIANISYYLEKEYDSINEKILDFCDLNLLTYVKKRTCDAVGISLTTLRRIRSQKELSKLPSLDTSFVNCQGCEIVTKLYHYLEEEYKSLVENNPKCCDLSLLSNITKRTADATGFGEDIVTLCLQLEKSEHNNDMPHCVCGTESNIDTPKKRKL